MMRQENALRLTKATLGILALGLVGWLFPGSLWARTAGKAEITQADALPLVLQRKHGRHQQLVLVEVKPGAMKGKGGKMLNALVRSLRGR